MYSLHLGLGTSALDLDNHSEATIIVLGAGGDALEVGILYKGEALSRAGIGVHAQRRAYD
jgi:hypothetical protein